jgi:hypothetical protein
LKAFQKHLQAKEILVATIGNQIFFVCSKTIMSFLENIYHPIDNGH